MRKNFFTSESVTEGHPDKVCDKISDAILDALLEQDPESHVACETSITTDFVFVFGEVRTKVEVDYEKIVRDTIREIGYDDEAKGFNCDTCEVKILLDEQSPDIAMGVDASLESREDAEVSSLGAGDQGMMFGYASDETGVYMPAAIYYAHSLTRELTRRRKEKEIPWLYPDGKSQVTVKYDSDGNIEYIDTIVISAQHSEEVSLEEVRSTLETMAKEVLPSNLLDEQTKFLINPTGRFVIGGPHGDAGLTGRKIVVDTYGGYAPHGGGAFSGKDPSKVDRSAAYMARYAAKCVVQEKLAKECEIQLAYAIGVANPVSVAVNTFGTGVIDDDRLASILKEYFDFTPEGIISTLQLKRPIYKATAAYGHFGGDFPWEEIDVNTALNFKVAVKAEY